MGAIILRRHLAIQGGISLNTFYGGFGVMMHICEILVYWRSGLDGYSWEIALRWSFLFLFLWPTIGCCVCWEPGCSALRTNTEPFKYLIFVFTGQGVGAKCKTIPFQNSIRSSAAAAKVRLKHKTISQIAIHKANRLKQQQQRSGRGDQMGVWKGICMSACYSLKTVRRS